MKPDAVNISLMSLIINVYIINCVNDNSRDFRLKLMHTNDIHSRFIQFTSNDVTCNQEPKETEKECFGGFARRYTLIKSLREYGDASQYLTCKDVNECEAIKPAKPAEKQMSLLLDAGDQFQGTPWFYTYKGKDSSHFMNRLNYDAMVLGNHEFDNGVAGLIPFLNNIKLPVLCSNMIRDPKLVPDEVLNRVNKSHEFIITNERGDSLRIGVIGYITSEVSSLSSTGNITFASEAESIQNEINELKKRQIQVFIAVGHAGLEFDKELAKKVPELSIIVGGHSHSLLFNGEPSLGDDIKGPYPIVVCHELTSEQCLPLSGKTKTSENASPKLAINATLIVQVRNFGKYLGHLNVIYNRDGHLLSWTGNPILLDKRIKEDVGIARELKEWEEDIVDFKSIPAGTTNVLLDARNNVCRLKECNLGNVVTDAEVYHFRQLPKWQNKNVLGILNGGSIRSSIAAGPISFQDVLNVFPFGGTFDIVEINGKVIRETFDNSINNYAPKQAPGKFLQVTGFKVVYDITGTPRVNEILVETDYKSGLFEPLDDQKIYTVVVSSYMYSGKDGFTMLAKGEFHKADVEDTELLKKYLIDKSPINAQLEGRITFIE